MTLSSDNDDDAPDRDRRRRVFLIGVAAVVVGQFLTWPLVNLPHTRADASLPGGGPDDFIGGAPDSLIVSALIGIAVIAAAGGAIWWGRAGFPVLGRIGRLWGVLIFLMFASAVLSAQMITAHTLGWTHEQSAQAWRVGGYGLAGAAVLWVLWSIGGAFLALYRARRERDAPPAG